jgi:hypothetical protein
LSRSEQQLYTCRPEHARRAASGSSSSGLRVMVSSHWRADPFAERSAFLKWVNAGVQHRCSCATIVALDSPTTLPVGLARRSRCREGWREHGRRRQKLGVCSAKNTSPSCRMPHTRMSLPLALSFSRNRTPSPTIRPDPWIRWRDSSSITNATSTLEVSQTARTAPSDLEHSSNDPRRHRLRRGERHAPSIPTVRPRQNPR